jgi:hypothetical protein
MKTAMRNPDQEQPPATVPPEEAPSPHADGLRLEEDSNA